MSQTTYLIFDNILITINSYFVILGKESDIEADEGVTVFVKNLNFSTTEETLKEVSGVRIKGRKNKTPDM